LIDGATDSSVTGNELVYARYLHEDGFQENHYIRIEDPQLADANGVVDAIKAAFE
jgi:hypothetical protein